MLDKEKLKSLDEFIDALPTKRGALISVLHFAQEKFGFLPTELQHHIARKLEIPDSKVYGVVTFYSFFTTKEKGKYKINVCMGTACFVRGAADVLEAFKSELKIDVGQTTEDKLFSLDSIRCVGACGLAPVVSINGKVFGRVGVDDVKGIIEEYISKEGENHE
jgi:NADH:ubiquinone oxidoreductase subunit E